MMTADSPNKWTGVWRTGPDAGVAIELPVGRHIVGRAHTAGFRCDDLSLQPHHALIEVTDDGAVRLTQLTGRTPLRVDARATDGPVELVSGSVVDVGVSTFIVRHSEARQTRALVHDGAVVRAPRTVPEWRPSEHVGPGERPTREASNGGLLPALLGLGGAGIIAVLLQQPMFLLFGALGTLVAIGSWIAQRMAATRKFRIVVAEYEQATVRYEQHLAQQSAASRQHTLATVPTADQAVRTLVERDAALWTRRATHPDAYLASIGISPADAGLPAAADLGPGSRIALLGPHGAAVARALVMQLVASCGPADLRITIVSDFPERWTCLRTLPHVTLPDGTAAIVPESGLSRVLDHLVGRAEHGAHHLLLTDQPALLATRTSPLRRALGDPQRDALIVVVGGAEAETGAAVPHVCDSVLTTTNGPLARWVADVQRTMLPQQLLLVGVGERTAARCAAAIRGLVDPEDPQSVASVVPREVSLVALMQRGGANCTPAAIAATWAAAGPDPAPRTAIGVAADGVVDVDLVRDGPHGLLAGTTGSGKSELLRSLVAGMAAAVSPTQLTFVLIDYKGGAAFDSCAALPHVVGMVTDLDDQLADRALRSLHAELRRREALLREHNVADLSELRIAAPGVTLPRLVVVIDEFAALVAEQPTFLHALVGIAQRGRSLGVHLLLATQRPSGVITDDIRANTNLRLALRLHDTADAIDVVGIATPAHLPRGVPGRAVMRLGADEHLTFQTARCTAAADTGGVSELAVLVRAICDAARLLGLSAPASPWLPPLPAMLAMDDLGSNTSAVGLVDEPDQQRTSPLRWSLADGRLAVVGSAGSGVTSTLLTLADQTLGAHDADVYVVDARGDGRWVARAVQPRCVAVVQLHEAERLHRLLHRLQLKVRNRQRNETATLLIIDGLDSLRKALDDPSTTVEFDALDQVLADADTAGITVVAGAESAAALPIAFLNRCPARWVLHLHDPHDAALLGVAARHVPPAVPGRIVIAGSQSMAQLVSPRPPMSPTTDVVYQTDARPITVVPAILHASQLPPSTVFDDVTALSLGVEFTSGEPFALQVPAGEHVLLIGTPRSGRSSGLARIANAWSQAHRESWVGAILPRRSAFPAGLASRAAVDATAIAALLDELIAHLAHGSALLIVDDAEAVDDANGRLADLAASCVGLSIAAAGRPDALRATYGHWTAVLRRSRLGLVATAGNELDGDLLSVHVPRRSPVPARPGLWWVADDSAPRLVQLAVDDPDRLRVQVAR